MNWDDAGGRFFNPDPTISAVPLPGGSEVLVADDVLLDPAGLVRWAGRQAFRPPAGFPYPGVVADAPAGLAARLADFFAQHARGRLGAAHTLGHAVRLSMVSTPPARLDPPQWQCHRDHVPADPSIVGAASVLYLFRDAALGGTSFYVPRQSPSSTDRIQADSRTLDAGQFGKRYGLEPGYMDGSNPYFECVARVPAAWNRMIFYDAAFFHSGDVGRPDRLTTDPATARLTLNAFFGCRRLER